MKENLENLLKDHIEDLVIHIQEKLAISELANVGTPLHGAKLVYVNETAEEFKRDPSFATIGSLMKTNERQIVAITAKHIFEVNNSNLAFVLVDNEVVRLGEQVHQSRNDMKSMEDDIAIVQTDEKTRSLINDRCEKLLLDSSGLPTPAQISLRNLEIGDIVHKRGAKTGLTTGVVRDIRIQAVGRFSKPSPVIHIIGRENSLFADYGDSGSLVYQHSLSPEQNYLEVHAMVQGKIGVPIPNADIVCFSLKEGCNTLCRNINGLQSLHFFDQ